MKYAVMFLCVLGLGCMYLAYRLGNARGRMDCEQVQSDVVQQAEDKSRRIQTAVARIVVGTATADIRRMLREKYTIAD